MINIIIKVVPYEEPVGPPTILAWNYSTEREADAFIDGFKEGQGWAVISSQQHIIIEKDELQLSLLED